MHINYIKKNKLHIFTLFIDCRLIRLFIYVRMYIYGVFRRYYVFSGLFQGHTLNSVIRLVIDISVLIYHGYICKQNNQEALVHRWQKHIHSTLNYQALTVYMQLCFMGSGFVSSCYCNNSGTYLCFASPSKGFAYHKI